MTDAKKREREGAALLAKMLGYPVPDPARERRRLIAKWSVTLVTSVLAALIWWPLLKFSFLYWFGQ